MRAAFAIGFCALVLGVSYFGRDRFREPGDSPSQSGAPSPDDVLADVPVMGRSPGDARYLALKAQFRANPSQLDAAVLLARAEVERHRASGDQRHLSYAQAALGAFWDSPHPPAEVRLLRATILQALHQFEPALNDLDALAAENPADPQVRLTRATVRSATGRHQQAKEDCEALSASASVLVSRVCLAQVFSNQGLSAHGYDVLSKTLRTEAPPPELAAWVDSTLGEAAMRSGAVELAEVHFRGVLERDPTDRYTRLLYVDLLLSAGRAESALTLLEGHEDDDAFLLRAAFANRPGAADKLRARQAAARERRDALHLREEALFALRVEHQANRALKLALENWAIQKQQPDAVLLLEAAVAANSPGAAAPLLQQLKAERATDPQLLALVEKLR